MGGVGKKMIGVILAGHGIWPDAMKKSLEMIMGEQKGLETCQVTDAESAAQIREKMDQAMERLGECDGRVILLDLFGGSPSHAAVSYGLRDDLLAFTGANLSMLIQLISVRDEIKWEDLRQEILQTGKDAVREIYGELSRTM